MIASGFNIFKNIRTYFFRFKFCPINQFRYEGFKQALSYGVIPTIAFFRLKTDPLNRWDQLRYIRLLVFADGPRRFRDPPPPVFLYEF